MRHRTPYLSSACTRRYANLPDRTRGYGVGVNCLTVRHYRFATGRKGPIEAPENLDGEIASAGKSRVESHLSEPAGQGGNQRTPAGIPSGLRRKKHLLQKVQDGLGKGFKALHWETHYRWLHAHFRPASPRSAQPWPEDR
ncbi:predicted protein [Brucella pinnipedialis M163/99/10]|uniref:Uncharacterized protein n=1 Tax=Brucella pinnipedialis M292/94/1 TaxID=520462 RepID=A0A0E1WWS6_9HYPH|nr:predicted protein [Brucella pinnipedialis M163/99/10]EEZ29285.1 predicted protein [Brucella pinnipedialis M292/94/1]